jgi:hypothetical protein
VISGIPVVGNEMTIKFTQPLVRLPIRFDTETLEAEVRALPRSAWVPHPNKFPGNDAVRLITSHGEQTDVFDGSMAPTGQLLACPYIMEIMAELGGVWGRSRLMGLAAGAEVPQHVDSHYYWRTHLRIHIPVITNPGVEFTCGGETVNMKPGECWVFDSFRRHEVHNRGSEHRVHLVLDTVGGGHLWDLVEQAQSGAATEPQLLEPGARHGEPLLYEQLNSPKVMSPWEMRCHVALLTDMAVPDPLLGVVLRRLDRFIYEWGALWAAYGTADAELASYRRLLGETVRDINALRGGRLMLKNDLPLYHVLERLVFEMAVAPLSPQTVAAPRRMAG